MGKEITTRDWLRSWPFHVSKLDKEKEQSLIDNGLIKDEEYGVFVHPLYGAFYWNQSCSSIEEFVESLRNEKFVIMSSFVDDPISDFLGDYDAGYEFVLGPCINYTNRFDGSEKGIYCKNYREMVDEKMNRSRKSK